MFFFDRMFLFSLYLDNGISILIEQDDDLRELVSFQKNWQIFLHFKKLISCSTKKRHQSNDFLENLLWKRISKFSCNAQEHQRNRSTMKPVTLDTCIIHTPAYIQRPERGTWKIKLVDTSVIQTPGYFLLQTGKCRILQFKCTFILSTFGHFYNLSEISTRL